MQAAAPPGAARLRADLGGSWGGAAPQSSGTECAWCHENVIEAKRCAACKVGAQGALWVGMARWQVALWVEMARWQVALWIGKARWACAHARFPAHPQLLSEQPGLLCLSVPCRRCLTAAAHAKLRTGSRAGTGQNAQTWRQSRRAGRREHAPGWSAGGSGVNSSNIYCHLCLCATTLRSAASRPALSL